MTHKTEIFFDVSSLEKAAACVKKICGRLLLSDRGVRPVP
jgi:hypothetical protein